MAGEVRTYNSARVLVLVGGVPLQGFAEGTFVNIAPQADRVTSKSGADGEVSRSISSDKRHTITVTLQQTSPSNDVLSGMALADELSGGGFPVPFLVQDLSGRTLFATDVAWVSRAPNITFGVESGDREWAFETGRPSVFIVGGNL